MQTYNIYYPEYNIENIIDILDSKRKNRKGSKHIKKIILSKTEILTNSLSPIQKHLKKRGTIINSDLQNLNFQKAVTFKKILT